MKHEQPSLPSRPQPAKAGNRPANPAEARTLPPTPRQVAAPSLPQPPASFGRYRLLKVLGQGGMGAVYLAHDTQLDRQVALKIPQFTGNDPSDGQRFLREARAAATLQHANLCPVYDVGEIDGTPYLTMAYIEGRPLSALVTGKNRPPARQIAAVVRKVALALEEAHRHGVIHRDLKPDNIMLNAKGEPIVMDFGLARRGNPADARLTQEGTVMGTPAYMAPEQARGNADEIGPATDIYSLGVVLYELLCGKLPFEGPPVAVIAQVLMEEPKPPSAHRPDVDPGLERICLRAMAKAPGDRYRTMAEFAAVLTEYLKAAAAPTVGLAPVTEPPGTEIIAPRPRRRKVRRRNWAALVGGVVVLLLAAGVVYVITHRAPGPTEPDEAKAPAEPVVKAPPPPPKEAVALVWPADALRDSKIRAPDLSRTTPWFHDDFSNTKSGFPMARGKKGENTYRGGKYFMHNTGKDIRHFGVPLGQANPPRPTGDFACQVVGRLLTSERGSWGLAFANRPETINQPRMVVGLGPKGQLLVRSGNNIVERPGQAGRGRPPHPAVHVEPQATNTLLVIVNGRQLEVYVNGIAVCDPVLLNQELPGPNAALWLGSGDKGASASIDSLTVWPAKDIPPPEQRGAVPKNK